MFTTMQGECSKRGYCAVVVFSRVRKHVTDYVGRRNTILTNKSLYTMTKNISVLSHIFVNNKKFAFWSQIVNNLPQN